MNMAKISRTENVYPVPDSKFPQYAHSNHHFAIALQKTSVVDEQLYFWSLTSFKKVFFLTKKTCVFLEPAIHICLEPEIHMFV